MTGMEIVELDWRIRIAGMRLADCFAIPPFLRGVERKRGGLDLEAEGRHAEVQKERKTRHNICAKKIYKIP